LSPYSESMNINDECRASAMNDRCRTNTSLFTTHHSALIISSTRFILLAMLISATWMVGLGGCSRGRGPGIEKLTVTVGLQYADVTGTDNRAVQTAINRVATAGGGTVLIRAGTYTLYNSVRLASHVSLKGEGP